MTSTGGKALHGREALQALAARFPQIYVAPAEDAQQAHRLASGRGAAPEGACLDHFASSPEDELREVDTPAGSSRQQIRSSFFCA